MTALRAEPRFADGGAAPEDAALALADGRACAAIAERDPAERARRVRDAVRALEAAGARVTLTGNPLRSPLTVERLIVRVGGDDGLDPAALIAEAASGAFSGMGRVVLAVEQAETLDSGAFAFLSALSRTLREQRVAFQLLFAGDERLPGLLRAHGFAVPEPLPDPARPAPAASGQADRPARSRRLVLAAAGSAVLISVATAAVLLGGRQASEPPAPADLGSAPPAPDAAAPAAAQALEPPSAPPPPADAPAPEAAAPPQPAPTQPAQMQPAQMQPAQTPAASAEERDAALQREFDAFLDAQGTQTAQLTPAQRAELFKAYVTWRARRESSVR